MLGLFINDGVVCNLNNTLLVIIHRSETRKINNRINK